MKERINHLTTWLKEKNYSFTFIQSKYNVFYLTGFQSEPHERLLGLIVFPDKEPFLICPNMEVQAARQSGFEGEIVGYSDSDDVWVLVKGAIHKRIQDVQSLAIEKEVISYKRCESLSELFPNASFVSVDTKLRTLRMIKDEKEISILREAAKLADYGIEIGINEITEGKTETEIIAKIEYELKKKGIQQMSFSTMVLTGDKSAEPHGYPGLRQIKRGDFVLFDLGVVLEGYCSDITRTVVYKEASEKQKEIYETVLKAQELSLSISKPGTRIADIDKVARDYITTAGYGSSFPHRIGHGLGIEVHEFPSLSENNEGTIQSGMVYTIEPGIYVPNLGGVRIEDDILIDENGPICLTTFPKSLQVIK